MSYLIDTNAWIALFEDAPGLSDEAADLMETMSPNCFISIASIWEAAIKVGIGKLKLPYDLHGDPFDRIQVVQARRRPLASREPRPGVRPLWACGTSGERPLLAWPHSPPQYFQPAGRDTVSTSSNSSPLTSVVRLSIASPDCQQPIA